MPLITIRNIGGGEAPIIRSINFLNNSQEQFTPANNSGGTYIASSFDLYYSAGVPGGGYANRYFTSVDTYHFSNYKKLLISGSISNPTPSNNAYPYIEILNSSGTVVQTLLNGGLGSINISADTSSWDFDGYIRIRVYNYCSSEGGSGSGTGKARFSIAKFELSTE